MINHIKKTGFDLHFTCCSLFFVLSTYFQALYFYKTYVIANVAIVLYVMYLMYVKYENRQSIVVDNLTFYLLGFLFAYMLSVFYSVNIEGAMQEAIRISGYLPAFLIGLYLPEIKRRYLQDAIVIAGIFVCIIGLLAFLGVIDMQGAVYHGRLQSTIGYANTTALYFLIAIILCINELLEKAPSNKVRESIFSIAFYILTIGLVLTFSRGVWILSIVTGCFALFTRRWIVENHIKVQCTFMVGVGVAGSLIMHITQIVWVSVLAILLGSILCIYAKRILRMLGWKILWFLPIVLFMALYVDSNLSLRIGWFVPTEWQARMGYYKGAMNMIADYPIIGAGARSFEILGYDYIGAYTKYTHQYYLQILCDVGIVGFSFFLLFIIGVIKSFIQVKHKDWHVFIIILIILLHAMIDVSFHFQLIAMLFFVYCGAIRRHLP